MILPRVCAVSYLNTVPLVWGMLHGAQRGLFALDFRIPSECADLLARGEADIGIVPAVEVDRLGLSIIPGTGIACRGAVRSILLFSKVPFDRIRTLAADSSSRTSVQLARIVLARRYGAEPRLFSHAPDLERMLGVADAALIIGDPALRLDPETIPYACLDLGAEWCDMTGYPMVFAVWAARRGFDPSGLAGAFTASCRFGLEHIDDIAAQESGPRRMSPELARDYFDKNVVLELGEREIQGMRLFLEALHALATVDLTA
ncbi:MAG TPA: menaquinone biosynthesis protein [Bryobacteraceae bacterium]|nr:menaquinone biosynthesis protein [Bryobacteraceae bacterium]